MKVAITSTGNFPGAKIDSRFGRCSYFVIYDTENQATEYIPNSGKDNIEGAGHAAVQLITSRNVRKVISGEFGTKVKSEFDRIKVQLIIMPDENKTVQDIIDYLNHRKH
ncbi:MAG: dinitrogenase iron-molybdenum cofactor biosynthesis protein [Bacteroidales bacterium]|nr:dinitrogenase iron-molybdenum cofactor biosynthesis protein [Bacteroidales bacterium]